jgi:hypothetical protein
MSRETKFGLGHVLLSVADPEQTCPFGVGAKGTAGHLSEELPKERASSWTMVQSSRDSTFISIEHRAQSAWMFDGERVLFKGFDPRAGPAAHSIFSAVCIQ